MQRLALVLASLSLACSGSHDTVVTPEPPPSSAPPTTVTPPPTEAPPAPTEVEVDSGIPPAPLSETTQPSEVRGRYVPWLDVESVSLPTGDTVHVRHPNALVRSRLDTLLDQQLNTLATDLRDASRGATPETEYLPTCRSVLATRSMVSVVCQGDADVGERGDAAHHIAEGTTFEIVGEDVHPVSIEDALVAGANIDPERSAAFDAELAANDWANRYGEGDWARQTEVLGADGIHSIWVDAYTASAIDATTPYTAIFDRVRGDGPIARLLRLGSFARCATPPASTAPGEPSDGPWAIGAPVPTSETATRWLSLTDRLRSATSVFLGPDGAFAQLGVTRDVGIETARELATALHGTLVAPATSAVARRFAIVRANGSVNVRTAPGSDGPWIGTLPLGATAVVPTDPTSATRPSWMTIFAAPALVGQSSSRYLDETDCMPDAASVLEDVPSAEREEASRNVLRIVTSAIVSGHNVPAALFLTHTSTRDYVLLRRLSSTCRTGAQIGSWTLDGSGQIVDALVTRTASQGGETLVLVASTDSIEDAEWSALRIGSPTPVWTHAGLAHPSQANDVVAPARRGPSGRGFWPLAIVQRRRPIVPYRWDGTTLVEDAP